MNNPAANDAELLRRYADERSEVAFAELVGRRVDFVYAVALRRLGGDAHAAEDVAQQVFVALAREAAALSRRRVLAGWFYTSARFRSAQRVRAERRRRAREQESLLMNSEPDDGAAVDWDRLRPVLDDALDQLGGRDREAVLLRFFEARSFGEIGAALVLTESPARMRVERAVEKLRGLLARRGVTSTTAALAVALARQTAVAAPPGLAVTITSAAVSSLAMSGAGPAATAIFMTIGKLSAVIVGGALIGGGASLWWRRNESRVLESELSRLRNRPPETASVQPTPVQTSAAAAEQQRHDDAELARLAGDAAALKTQLRLAKVTGHLEGGARPGMAQEALYSPRQLDQQPTPTYRKVPNYPDDMRAEGREGEAIIRFTVKADGTVADIGVVSSTHPSFEAAAMAALKEWTFQAGKKAGAAVNVQLQMPIQFTVSKDEVKVENWF